MVSRVNIKINIFFKFILSCQESDNCSHCLPLALLTPVANLPPVSTTLAKPVANFADLVVETGGKFAASVVYTGGNFAASVVDTSGKFATVVVDTSGAS